MTIFEKIPLMPAKKGSSSWASLIIVVLLLIALFAIRTCRSNSNNADNTSATKTESNRSNRTTSESSTDNRGLNRNPSVINYSKHAQCRMSCRHISKAEVKEILENGKINYTKSELKGAECKKRYAVEGTTTDKQRVRIIFAPCQTEMTVVTVIDIGKEWACDCE